MGRLEYGFIWGKWIDLLGGFRWEVQNNGGSGELGNRFKKGVLNLFRKVLFDRIGFFE